MFYVVRKLKLLQFSPCLQPYKFNQHVHVHFLNFVFMFRMVGSPKLYYQFNDPAQPICYYKFSWLLKWPGRPIDVHYKSKWNKDIEGSDGYIKTWTTLVPRIKLLRMRDRQSEQARDRAGEGERDARGAVWNEIESKSESVFLSFFCYFCFFRLTLPATILQISFVLSTVFTFNHIECFFQLEQRSPIVIIDNSLDNNWWKPKTAQ